MIVSKIFNLLVADVSDKLKGLTKAYTEYFKAVTYENLVIIISGITIISILFITINLFLLFLFIGLALYIGHLLGSFALGFVILGAVYLLVGLLFFVMRKRWIISPTISALQKIMYSDEGVFDKLVKVEEEEKVVGDEIQTVEEEVDDA
jgi:membrane protein implicated in regulation of membrane protease activity